MGSEMCIRDRSSLRNTVVNPSRESGRLRTLGSVMLSSRSWSARSARRVRPIAVAALVLTVGLLATACDVTVPSDPSGTLQRIDSTGELRVGATPAGAALVIDGSDVSGPLADLVEGFAQAHDARVAWVIESEETLVDLSLIHI